jgi:protein TonB
MNSLRISDLDCNLASPKNGAISSPLLASIFIHILIGFLVNSFLPSPLVSILTAPAKTISVILSPAIPEAKETPPIPPKQKPLVKPKPIPKKKIVTKAKSSVAVQKKKPKPIKKAVIEPVVVPKPKIIPVPQIEAKPSAPIPAPISQQATLTPQPTYKPKPAYPSVARRRGIEGTVVFEIFLNNNGSVSKAIITQSSGSGALDKSALKTIKTWRFPANRFNSLTSFKQSIQFRLHN